jgi:hypothetical protein
MFELDTWFTSVNRSEIQKETEAIELPYRCGRIEAELIAIRFNARETVQNYNLVQPKPLRILT